MDKASGTPARVMHKSRAVFFGKLAAFLCLLCLMANGAGTLLDGGTDTVSFSSDLRHIPANSADVLWLGSSHMHYAVIPQRMFDEHGIASAMATGNGMPLSSSYWMLCEALQTQSPKVVVLDVFFAVAPYAYARTANAYALHTAETLENRNILAMMTGAARWLPMGSLCKLPAAMEAYRGMPASVYDLFSLSMFHTRYGELTKENFDFALGESRLARNFGYFYTSHAFEEGELVRQPYTVERATTALKDRLWEFDEEQLESAELLANVQAELQRVVDLAKARGVKLALCATPYVVNRAEEKLLAQVERFAAQAGVAYIGPEGARIDELALFNDMGHLNYRGARIYTDYLADELKRIYSLPDRRGSDDARYAPWVAGAGRDEAQNAAEGLSSLANPEAYLEALAKLGGDYLVAVVGTRDGFARLTEAERAGLERIGLNVGNTGDALAAVLCGGEIRFSTARASGSGGWPMSAYVSDHRFTFERGEDSLRCMADDGKAAALDGGGIVLLVYDRLENRTVSVFSIPMAGEHQ